jgi:hypothetical protein
MTDQTAQAARVIEARFQEDKNHRGLQPVYM